MSPDILTAQQRALETDQRIESLSLDPIRRGVPDLPLEDSIVSATSTLTIEGASTVTIAISDPDWMVEHSGLLGTESGDDLPAARITLDGLAYRLVEASRRSWDVLELVFEDEVVSLLRRHTKPRSWSRGSVTRAQAIEAMVREVKAREIVFYSPEKGKRQPTAQPDRPEARPSPGETGFDDGATFKIKGQRADAQQMREVATALEVADQEGAKGRARLALIVAGIGESNFRAVVNSIGYGGVFQGDVSHRYRYFKKHETDRQAYYFLRGGKGFQQGGAIKLAKDNPGMSAGEIATRVEASGKPGSFYHQHAPEARKIIAKWGGSDGAETDTVTTVRAYQFRRGGPDNRGENSWDAATRLAEEVQWRLFAYAGEVWFVADDYLISKPASLTLEGPLAPGLLEPPTYDRDNGKPVQETTLRVSANRWSVRPGEVVTLDELGPLSGRWIIQSVEQDLLDATETTVTLTKGQKAKKEPAPEISQSSVVEDASDGPAGAERAVRWARSKLGHYKEEFGSNTGDELDRLQQNFGMRGAPWCAMFATTAVQRGGVTNDCKTAAVAQIYAWAQAGTHGYTRGTRATPKPGDLMLFDPPNPNDHVGIVEKVNGDTITTIEGNTSANKVARLTRKKSTGVFVRPDYPN